MASRVARQTVSSNGESGGANPDRVVVLGKIGGAFGVQGWNKITSYTEPFENILEYAQWLVGGEGRWRPIEVEDGRITAKGVLVKLAGVETPEDARLQSGLEIGVPRGALPPPEPGEYYWSDLEGMQALSRNGEVLGQVDHFRATPAGSVIVVRGEREHWIPFVKDRVVSVDLQARRIVLDWAADW